MSKGKRENVVKEPTLTMMGGSKFESRHLPDTRHTAGT